MIIVNGNFVTDTNGAYSVPVTELHYNGRIAIMRGTTPDDVMQAAEQLAGPMPREPLLDDGSTSTQSLNTGMSNQAGGIVTTSGMSNSTTFNSNNATTIAVWKQELSLWQTTFANALALANAEAARLDPSFQALELPARAMMTAPPANRGAAPSARTTGAPQMMTPSSKGASGSPKAAPNDARDLALLEKTEKSELKEETDAAKEMKPLAGLEKSLLKEETVIAKEMQKK